MQLKTELRKRSEGLGILDLDDAIDIVSDARVQLILGAYVDTNLDGAAQKREAADNLSKVRTLLQLLGELEM